MMPAMKKISFLMIIAALGAASASASDGLLLIGYSLKQMGVGGAVTANPMTPVTAINNPAGLAFVDAQTDATIDFALLNLHAHFNAAPSADAKSLKKVQLIPSLGMMAPTENPRVRFGLGVAVVAGSGTDFSWPSLSRAASSDLQIIKIAPATSYKIDDRTSIGGALHFNIGRASLANPGFGPSTLPTAFAHGTEMIGYGFGLGIMRDCIPGKLQFGLSYQSGTNFANAEYGSTLGTYEGDFNLPQQAAFGTAYQLTPKLKLSGDLKWINYEDTLKSLMIYGPGLPSDGLDLGTNWRDQYVMALGAQYTLSEHMKVLAGYNHCSAPFGSSMMSKNLLLPAIARNHYTFGVTYDSDSRWSLGLLGVYSPKHSVTDGTTTVSNETFTVGFNATIRF